MSHQFQVLIEPDKTELSRVAATSFADSGRAAVSQRGIFTVALSGGSTPRGLHRLLAEEPFVTGIPWHETHIFWVDERCVPFENPASNYGAAREDFLDHIPAVQKNVHPMPAHMPPEEGAEEYQFEITRFFGKKAHEIPVFDLILLGIGTDGHTASLFPGDPALHARGSFIVAVKGGTPNVHRLTMTYPILNGAREILFLATGKDKAAVVRALIEKEQKGLPAQGIHPISGKLTWLLDRQAAALLKDRTR